MVVVSRVSMPFKSCTKWWSTPFSWSWSTRADFAWQPDVVLPFALSPLETGHSAHCSPRHPKCMTKKSDRALASAKRPNGNFPTDHCLPNSVKLMFACTSWRRFLHASSCSAAPGTGPCCGGVPTFVVALPTPRRRRPQVHSRAVSSGRTSAWCTSRTHS